MVLLLVLLLPFLGITGTLWLLLFASIAAYFYYNIKKKQSFWEKKGIPYIKPKFFLGNMQILRSTAFPKQIQALYNAYPDKRYCGTYQFTLPVLLIRDPDLIKQITVKEFDHFINHRLVISQDVDPFWSKNLLSSRDERWRDLRATLSPSFTGSKMKVMYALMDQCAQQFVAYVKNENEEIVELEIKDALSRYTNDVIATTAFGLKCDSLKNQKNEFYLMGKDASDFGGLRIFKFFLHGVSPALAKLLRVRIISTKHTNYFSNIIEETVRTRKENNIVRPDMIHLLMEAQKERQHHDGKQEITLEDINSQAFIFFLAGFETVSTFLTFTFYELAINPEIQKRLRDEIQSGPEKITYEALLGMKYLDMVVSESLRKWTPASVTDREVTKDFTIQPEEPNEKPLFLEKGTLCWLPLFAIHNDPKFYPDPDKFDPERFSDENRHKINPSAYLPFGAGPRNCIGSRFALLEGKLIICYVLKNFEVVQVEKTQNPVVLDKSQINLTAQGGMWLGFKKIK